MTQTTKTTPTTTTGAAWAVRLGSLVLHTDPEDIRESATVLNDLTTALASYLPSVFLLAGFPEQDIDFQSLIVAVTESA